MDFISNLIKRPISLVLNDAVPTTEQMQNSARSNRSQTPPSPLGRGVSPPQNGHCIAAGATAISNATVINALRLSDEFLPIAAPIRTLPSPPASPSALLPCLHSNSSSTHSNSVTSNTIEELLIQINDSLNEATISDGAATENHNKSPVSTPSPIALSTVELSLKSAGLKLPPSPRPKETPATSTASTTVAMAPAANAASAEEATLQSLRSKAGLFDGLPFQLNHNTGVNTACTKFVGLTEFDESSIPELPGHLNPNIEEHLKLTFEEGLIPTLTANINQQQQQLNSIMQKDDINNKAHQQLFVPNESDTAVSSDSEIFAECQSYQDGIINISSEYMGDEFNTENSGMDAFFSAANSRNTTITNVITNPLDTTIEMALQAAKTDAAAYSSQQEERLEACSPTGTAAIATVDSTKLPGEKPLVVEEAKPLEPRPETTSPCLVNVTFGDEPMDVDMSLTQEQFLQSGALDLEAPSPNDVNSAGDSPVEEAVTSVKTCDHNVKSTDTVENEAVGSNSTTVSPSLSNADGNSLSASAGSELEIHQSKHEVSLNKSVELPAQHSEKNSFSDCVLQDNKVGSSANDLNTASPITDATQIITTASAASSLNASDEDCKEYVPTKVVEVAPAEMTASQKSLAEATGKVNISAEMDSSISSSKSSTCSSSSFPIKRGPNDLKQFPRSPTKVVEKEMAYLEKSEYTERKEIERKKSLATEIKIVPTTPPKEVENENEATTLTPADLNSTIDLCTPQSDKFAMSPTTPDTDVALNSTFNDTTSLSTPGATAMSERKSADATSPSSRNTAEAEMQSPPASLNDSDKKTRRTFNVPPLNKSLEQRRTFNVSPTLQVSHQNESSEPMDVDDTLPLSSPIAAEPPSIATIQREGNEKDAATIPSQTLSASPPIPTLMNRQMDDAALTAQPPSSTITTSPPIPTLMNRQRNAETLLMMPPVPKTVPISPPVPALMKRELVARASQSVPSQPACQRDEATLMMPPPPPPSQTTIYSPPIPTLQKRPPIHPTIDPFLSTEIPEVLSAKEQTKSNASDEKDVFAGNSTPSPMEEAPSVGFSGFGDGDDAVGREEFNDADFQSCNNLILNPSDFDYLLTKGNNNAPVDRSSILLRFDPLLGVPVAANQLPPIKPAQPLFQQILGNNALCLSPTLEEDEAHTSSSHDNSQSFVVEHKNRSFETNSAAKSAKLQDEQSAKVKQEYTQGNQPHEAEDQNPAANTKKDARMSVDVIKDMNVDNDCNKSFENSNSQSDEKQINYKMDDLEKKIKNEVLKTEDIEKKLKEAEQREEALIKRITEKDKTITKMNGVIEAYEKAIAELIAEKEQLIQNYEKQLSEVKTDRDSNYQHLTSLETTFSDLHVKYEKSKEMTLQLKSNEEVLLAERRQILENLRLQEQRYDKMKNHAMQQLEIANKKLETLNKEHSVESTKLKALLKKEEISRASINEQLQQKSRENAELVKICDELINGQGS